MFKYVFAKNPKISKLLYFSIVYRPNDQRFTAGFVYFLYSIVRIIQILVYLYSLSVSSHVYMTRFIQISHGKF